MRTCAKLRCGGDPVATIVLRYGAREVVVAELMGEPGPNLIDLCQEHVGRLRPPLGWTITDARAGSLSPAN